MNPEMMDEREAKEKLKSIVDSYPVYTDEMKEKLKDIIESGKQPEEIFEQLMAYFSTIQQK